MIAIVTPVNNFFMLIGLYPYEVNYMPELLLPFLLTNIYEAEGIALCCSDIF